MRQLFESSKLGKEQIDFMLSNAIIDEEVQAYFEICMNTSKAHGAKKDLKQAFKQLTIAKEHDLNLNLNEAIVHYNKGILLLDLNSKELLSKILTERAKILEQLREYEECLIDIEDAIKFSCKTYPDLDQFKKDITEKLIGYNLKLREEFGPQRNRLNICALTENKQLPSASSLVKMNYSPDKGRFIQAQADIPKGTIVFAEEAYVKWLKPSQYEKFCYFCIKKITLRFFPCRNCTNVRFCCSNCEEEAWNKYHSNECNYLGVLKYFSYGHIAAQCLLIAGIENVIEIEKQTHAELSKWPKKEFKQDYHTFASLCAFDGDWPYPYNFTMCFAVLLVLRLLEKMNLITKQSEDYSTIGYIMIKLISKINLNCYSILNSKFRHLEALNVVSHKETNDGIGTAIYLSASLPSHSCDPNCMKIRNGSMLILTSTRKVKTGEEITITYRPHFKNRSFKDRQHYLYENYSFKCKCNACENVWENIGYSFKCPNCEGPLILNSDKTNYCVECSAANVISYDDVIKQYEESERLIRESKKLFAQNKIDESKELLLKANQILCSFYSHNDQIAIDYLLARCCELQKNYREALKYAKQVIKKQENIFGKSSLEVANTLLLCSLLCDRYKKTFGGIFQRQKRQEAKLFREKALNIFKCFSKSEIRVVSADFSHYLPYVIHILRKYGDEYSLNYCKV
ncbi:SET and MYND domain-containing protein 4-like protein [Dinothrombium tinctorium]|nr:SET and MYND domain-containing protein 4-like protein [Dinothrombium tinctorium]